MPIRILVDLDDVLADFTGGVEKIHGLRPGHLKRKREWDLPKFMGMFPSEFWEPILDAGEDWWAQLEPLDHVEELIDNVDNLSDTNWFVVSDASYALASYAGKVRWANHFFGDPFDQLVLTRHKEILANPTTILIDDKPENVLKFREAGGIGLLFPAWVNDLHEHAAQPMDYFIPLLQETVDALQVP